MSRKSHHVTPYGNDQWQVKKGGADRASGVYPTKSEAVAEGRKISQNQNSELVIHNRDGHISQSDSHGKDPFPPRG